MASNNDTGAGEDHDGREAAERPARRPINSFTVRPTNSPRDVPRGPAAKAKTTRA